jgi:NADPH-dependent 2,4-dienoyl-CoA reductase/sulfur reductase-like enzyme
MQPAAHTHTVAIVGAGPAGMSAAITLAEAGVRPLVIDENPLPGGQIYRQPAVACPARTPVPAGSSLLRRFAENEPRLELLLGTSVWGLFAERRLAVVRDGRSQTIQAQHLILAPGAHEYLPPFPGWTLPGVMTPGAAQGLVKTMNVLPGKRALVAGTGPFLLVVADQLARAGVEVVGVVEMASRVDALRAVPALLARPGLVWQGMRLHLRLRRAGVPFYWKHVLFAAEGTDTVSRAVFAPCDKDGRPDRSRARTVEVDTICAGYGFVPRIQLAQLAGCRLRFMEGLGGWVPEVDEEFQTSVDGVWTAGDGGGVSGALAAEHEGALAGLAIAQRLGALDRRTFEARRRPLWRRLARLRRFAAGLERAFRLRPGLIDLATPETLVCRCEELSRRAIEEGIASGGTDVRTLKVISRLGMGPCQGMMCWPAAARLIAAHTGAGIEAVGPPSTRPPIVPVCLGDLVDEEPATGPQGTAAPAGTGRRLP